jgi:CDP-diacylglycerol---serine O-phosphatidyltransferase
MGAVSVKRDRFMPGPFRTPPPKSESMRKVYILPNLFTSLSLFCGLLAIFEGLDLDGQGSIVRAMHLLILAGVLDMMDGMVARLTRTQSMFGMNLDSLADLVAFGAAPAVLAYHYMLPAYPLLAKATCGLYVVCGALRLARYNVQAQKEERREFTGLPIPGGAAAVGSLIWVLALWPGINGIFPIERVLPVMLVVVAYLMVSKFPYTGPKSLSLWRRQRFEILVTIVVIMIILFSLKEYFEIIALVFMLGYLTTGPLRWFRERGRASAGVQVSSSAKDASDTTSASPRP